MTGIEANEKLKKFNYLVGKAIAQDTIAAIIPLPIDSKMTAEEMVTMIFNNTPHKLFDCSNFRIIVMLNIQEFYDNGVVIWKDLDDVLALLEIEEDN
ncbi:MAG: hypothetical protein JWR50_3709 [Mucilaginibacter sp.]|nr:hypothetical protein [Mucilaginibacter sp.]